MKVNLFILICIFLNGAQSLNSYGFIDKTINWKNEVYSTSGTTCVFKYYFLIIDEVGSLGFNQITLTNSELISNNIKVQSSNGTAVFIQVNTEFPIGNGSLSFQIVDINSDPHMISNVKNYTCENVPYPITFEPVKNFICNSYLAGGCTTLLKYTNLLKTPKLSIVSDPPYLCSATQDSVPSNIVIQCTTDPSYSIFDPNISLKLTDPTGNITTLLIPSFIENVKPNITIRYVPEYTLTSSDSPSILFEYEGTQKPYVSILTTNYNGSVSSSFVFGTPDQRVDVINSFFQSSQNVTLSYFENYIRREFISIPINFPPAPYLPKTYNIPPSVNSLTDNIYSIDMTTTNYIDFTGEQLYFYYNSSTIFYDITQYMYPQGIISGKYLSSSMKRTFILPPYQGSLNYQGTIIPIGSPQIDNQPPKINSIEFISISMTQFIRRISFEDDLSGLSHILRYNIQTSFEVGKDFDSVTPYIYADNIVSGTINNGVMEYIEDLNTGLLAYTGEAYVPTDLMTNNQRYDNFIGFNEIPANPVNIPYVSGYLRNINITDFSWMLDSIDVTKVGANNTLYFGFEGASAEIPVLMVYISGQYVINFPIGRWDSTKNRYEFDIYVSKGTPFGDMDFAISSSLFTFSSSSLYNFYGSTKKLKISSEYSSILSPNATQIIDVSELDNGSSSFIGWEVTIQDQYWGFKQGYIIVTSDIDFVNYNLSIKWDNTKNRFLDTYTISFPFNTQFCLSQTFTMTNIHLCNMGDICNRYPDFAALAFRNSTSIIEKQVNVTCASPTDTNPPVLSDLIINLNTSEIDVGSSSRSFTVDFTIIDQDNTPISIHNLPVCFLSTLKFRDFGVTAELTNNIPLNVAKFRCNVQIPFGFGAGNSPLALSIHGYSDLFLNLGGVSAYDINLAGFEYKVPTKMTYSEPVIDSTSIITSLGGTMIIYGHNLCELQDSSNSMSMKIEYNDGTIQNTNASNLIISQYTTIALVINNILPNKSSFNITIIKGSISSKIFNVQIVQIPKEQKPTIPTSPPIPTAPSCPDNCGNTNGKCVSGTCICNNPWIGSNCLSQVILTPPQVSPTEPEVNNTNSVELPSGEKVTLKSLISLVSIDEYHPDNSLYISHKFNQWIYTDLSLSDTNNNTLDYQYKSDILYNSQYINVTTLVQIFTLAEDIIFANDKIPMLPASSKYNIQIKNYPFKSPLNYLQVVMRASIESPDSQQTSCSTSETGTDTSNSDYYKLQIDNHSLYARFIKRGIVDNRIVQVGNVILQDNSVKNTNNQQNILIGINIPYFIQNAIIDPDFSLLIDSKPAQDSNTSTCPESNSNTKSKLSKAQLAGIIIGSVGFAVVVVISVSYYIYKKKENQNFMNKLNTLSSK